MGGNSGTPLADALAGVDHVQGGSGFGLGPVHELAALRDLAEAVRVHLLAHPESPGEMASAESDGHCVHCVQSVRRDGQGTLIDASGGDVCGWDGGNEPHELREDVNERLDALGFQEVPQHHNDLGDHCPHSGHRTPDGTCPVYCKHADEMVGFDAGDRDVDDDVDEGALPHAACDHGRGWWPCLQAPETAELLAARREEIRRLEIGAAVHRVAEGMVP